MSFPRRRRAPLAPAGLALVALAGCGQTTGPNPTPSPSPTRSPGGVVVGNYLLEITPSARCVGGTRVTFPVELAAANTPQRTAYQGTHAVDLQHDRSALELEVMSVSNRIQGGFATRHDGCLSQENVQVWVHGVGDGAVTSFPGGRGEVLEGTIVGYLAFAPPGTRENGAVQCSEADHRFRLTTR